MTCLLAVCLVTCALASACTLDAGQGFATMKDGELSMALEVSEARDLGEGAFRTDRGYRVYPRELSLRVEHVVLLEATGQRATSEPAEPALCHGEHCHADDGSLVEGSEDEQVSDGSGARYAPLVEAHLDRAFELIGGERAALGDFEPSAELPEGSIDRIELELTDLRMRGHIEGGELTERVALEIQLPLGVPLTHAVSLAIDRDSPEEISPRVTVHFDASALDGLDLASLAEDGVVALDGRSVESDALLAWLARAEIAATFDE